MDNGQRHGYLTPIQPYQSDFVEYQRPRYYADCLSEKDIPPVDPLTANLPPELASAILLLQAELKRQHQALTASQHMLAIYSDHLHIALQNCASCGKLLAKNSIHAVPAGGVTKEGCEEVAAADLSALCAYTRNATGWREPDISDTIDLKFVERSGSYAVYRSEKGLKCEVGELDWRGIGSLYIYEEQDEDE